VFDRVGLLDEDFFLNQEDLEFCLRLRLAGYRLLVATDAYVHHLGGGSKLSLAPTRQLALHAEATRILLQKLTARFGDDVPPLDTLWGDVALGAPPAPRLADRRRAPRRDATGSRPSCRNTSAGSPGRDRRAPDVRRPVCAAR